MISTVENNIMGEWEVKLSSLSPETRELFFRHSGRLILLGLEIQKRDSDLRRERELKKTPGPKPLT